MRHSSRRDLLKFSATAIFAAGLRGGALAKSFTAGAAPSPMSSPAIAIKKGIFFEMLPVKLSYADRFKLARDAGFEVVQVPRAGRK